MCNLINWFVWVRAWLCKYLYWPVCQKVVGTFIYLYIFFLLNCQLQLQIKACLEWSLDKCLSLLLWIQNAISSCFHIWTYSVLLPFITVNCVTFNVLLMTTCHGKNIPDIMPFVETAKYVEAFFCGTGSCC